MTDLTYRSPKTEVKASPIEGKGLFAKEAIAAGEIVAVKGGRIFTRKQWAALEGELGPAQIEISDDFVIAPGTREECLGSMLYTNHSCEPNIAIQGQIVLVAMRDIAAGEEVCFDYAMSESHPLFEFGCNCGSALCRGRTSAEDWRNPELQFRYAGYFSPYLQRRIEALRREVAIAAELEVAAAGRSNVRRVAGWRGRARSR